MVLTELLTVLKSCDLFIACCVHLKICVYIFTVYIYIYKGRDSQTSMLINHDPTGLSPN